MSELISVIVPVYNTAAYLEECVRSVLAQTYPDFELILVDDGSTDGSLELCREFCAQDSRIRLLQREHGGVSAARNAAIKEARGKYLFFLDSDDSIHLDLLRSLCALAEETGAAVAAADYIRIEENEPWPQGKEPGAGWHIYLNNQDALALYFSSRPLAHLLRISSGRILRREYLTEMVFDESLCNGEDTKFFYQLLERGADMAILQEQWYYYRCRGTSATGGMTQRSYQSCLECMHYVIHREWERNRRANAAYEEERIVFCLLDGYRTSRREHNRPLKAYIWNAMSEERKTPPFRIVPMRCRMRLNLAFFCYPLYLPIHLFSHWLWKRRQRKGERHG